VHAVTPTQDATDKRISNGYLPLAVLEAPNATATGLLDLSLPLRTLWPVPALFPADPRDQLLMVRLHGEPVAIAYVERPPAPSWEQDDLEALWRACSAEIIGHVRRCGCIAEPRSADELVEALANINPPPETDTTASQRSASVIIATTGRQEPLQRCIQSLIELQYREFEIIIVDNRPTTSSTRELVESFKAQSPVEIRYVAEPRPGLSIARNAGTRASSAELLAYTDDDVVVDPTWLAKILEPFADERVGAVTGLVMPSTLETPVQKRFELYAGFGKGLQREIYDMGENRATDRLLYPYWGGVFGSGNSMAFTAAAMAEVGGFDPALGAGTPTGGGEDIALYSDVILGGRQLVYEPRSLGWHEHRAEEGALTSQVYAYGVGFTAVLFKYLTHDPRFLKTAVGSIPLVIRLIRRRSGERAAVPTSKDLARLEAKGRLAGPWCYARSWLRVRRAGVR
jgi:O-antigen biosynthesis protein